MAMEGYLQGRLGTLEWVREALRMPFLPGLLQESSIYTLGYGKRPGKKVVRTIDLK